MGGPDVNLAAFADRPTISRFLQRVRFNPERERVSFEYDGILRLVSPHREAEIRRLIPLSQVRLYVVDAPV
jgi:hypothetical protein